MKTWTVQKNIFNTEKTLNDLTELVSEWEEENMENDKSENLKTIEKDIKQKFTKFEKYYQKIKENISF